MSATRKGVPEDSRRTQDLNERDEAGDAKARADFEAAPIKGFEDLPADHPMAMRQATLEAIEQANLQRDAHDTGGEEAASAAEAAEAAPAEDKLDISSFKDPDQRKPVEKPAAKPADKEKKDTAEQVALQTEPTVLDVADLAKYQVRVKVDGVEELQPADKVFRQFQKGAAADVRLAKATQEAKSIVEAAQKTAAQLATTAAPAADKAQNVVKASQAATEKFKEAAEAMYLGNAEQSAELFAEATALAQSPPAEGRADGATLTADLVSKVTAGVSQQLSQQGALKKLFSDYPEIESKKAFALVADEYATAFRDNGDDIATAIFKAGEAIGEEYKLGKWAPDYVDPNAPKKDAKPGRPLISGGPTTRAEKLSAKDELDNITSGNARASTTEPREESVLEQLEEMRRKRPGNALT